MNFRERLAYINTELQTMCTMLNHFIRKNIVTNPKAYAVMLSDFKQGIDAILNHGSENPKIKDIASQLKRQILNIDRLVVAVLDKFEQSESHPSSGGKRTRRSKRTKSRRRKH